MKYGGVSKQSWGSKVDAASVHSMNEERLPVLVPCSAIGEIDGMQQKGAQCLRLFDCFFDGLDEAIDTNFGFLGVVRIALNDSRGDGGGIEARVDLGNEPEIEVVT